MQTVNGDTFIHYFLTINKNKDNCTLQFYSNFHKQEEYLGYNIEYKDIGSLFYKQTERNVLKARRHVVEF